MTVMMMMMMMMEMMMITIITIIFIIIIMLIILLFIIMIIIMFISSLFMELNYCNHRIPYSLSHEFVVVRIITIALLVSFIVFKSINLPSSMFSIIIFKHVWEAAKWIWVIVAPVSDIKSFIFFFMHSHFYLSVIVYRIE